MWTEFANAMFDRERQGCHESGGALAGSLAFGYFPRVPANPYDWFPEAPRLLSEATADKIEAHPELLRVPLDNIDRWIA